MHALLHSVPPTLQQATTDPCRCWRLLDTHGQVWVSLLWGHCSFLMGHDAHKILLVPSKSLFPKSCVSSGSSMVGLMAMSSKRAYAIPKSVAPKAPDHLAVHCWLIPLQETLKHRSVSVNKKGFLGDQCKKIEGNKRMGQIRYPFKKIRDTKGNISCKSGYNKGQKWYGPNRRRTRY